MVHYHLSLFQFEFPKPLPLHGSGLVFLLRMTANKNYVEKMPREKTPKRESSGGPRNANPLFSKDLGQHILKNPLVVNGIIEKVICVNPFWEMDDNRVSS